MLSNQKIESKDSIIQLLLKQRTQKPVINAMMAADYAESNLTNPKDEFSARRFANLSERKRELS